MKIFRAIDISIPNDLSGFGASVARGTWHIKSQDVRMIYSCEESSTCLLEKMANSKGILPLFLNFQEISGLETDDIELVQNLPPNWDKNKIVTQNIGMDWLQSKRSLALRVPSKVGYKSHNILINPAHSNFSKIDFTYEKYETDIRFQGSY